MIYKKYCKKFTLKFLFNFFCKNFYLSLSLSLFFGILFYFMSLNLDKSQKVIIELYKQNLPNNFLLIYDKDYERKSTKNLLNEYIKIFKFEVISIENQKVFFKNKNIKIKSLYCESLNNKSLANNFPDCEIIKVEILYNKKFSDSIMKTELIEYLNYINSLTISYLIFDLNKNIIVNDNTSNLIKDAKSNNKYIKDFSEFLELKKILLVNNKNLLNRIINKQLYYFDIIIIEKKFNNKLMYTLFGSLLGFFVSIVFMLLSKKKYFST